MKGNMLAFASLCSLLCWMLPVDSSRSRFNFTVEDANQVFELNMAEDSIDDMYFGCNTAMMKLVKSKYLKEDKRMTTFADAWNDAKTCVKKSFTLNKGLTEDHKKAICVYTADSLYKMFNDAVRTGRSSYASSFEFHSLHFLLTSAIQILNDKNHCYTTYRRNSVTFTGTVNQIIRFGSFTSTSESQSKYEFGKKTCFEIKTCLGASVKKYSVYKKEEEVLIPPYEMFKINEITTGEKYSEGLRDCEVVFVLESVGIKSNLNCKLNHRRVPWFFSN